MALWRISEMGAEGESDYVIANLSGKRTGFIFHLNTSVCFL